MQKECERANAAAAPGAATTRQAARGGESAQAMGWGTIARAGEAVVHLDGGDASSPTCDARYVATDAGGAHAPSTPQASDEESLAQRAQEDGEEAVKLVRLGYFDGPAMQRALGAGPYGRMSSGDLEMLYWLRKLTAAAMLKRACKEMAVCLLAVFGLIACGQPAGRAERTSVIEAPCEVSRNARGDAVLRCGSSQVDLLSQASLPPIKTRRVTLLPGSDCPQGGVALLFGYDEDGDGLLGEHEVTDRLVECGRDIDEVALHYGGHLTIDSAATLAAASLYTHIDGDLTYAYDGPVDTVALPRLREVAGNLVVHAHPHVRHMAGLRSLQRVGGTLQLTDDPELATLAGLDKLAHVGGLVIAGDAALERLDGLPALTRVSGAVLVSNNPNLRLIDAMSGAPTDWRGAIGGPVQVSDNPRLERLVGFDNFVRSSGDIWVHDNRRLQHVGGFGALGVVEGHIKFMGLERLSELSGFNALEAVGGIRVQRNNALAHLFGFGALMHVARDVAIVGNAQLTTLTGFENLTLVGGALRVVANPVLRGLDGMGALVQAQTIDVQNNLALGHLEGLRALTAVGADIHLRGNPVLTNLGGLRALASVMGDLVLAEQGALENLDGLLSLSHVGGSLRIAGNGALRHVLGLRGLDSVGGDMVVRDNPTLDTLKGLDALRSVGGRVVLCDNLALADANNLDLSAPNATDTSQSRIATASLPCLDAL